MNYATNHIAYCLLLIAYAVQKLMQVSNFLIRKQEPFLFADSLVNLFLLVEQDIW